MDIVDYPNEYIEIFCGLAMSYSQQIEFEKANEFIQESNILLENYTKS